jgi:hypothetical protein
MDNTYTEPKNGNIDLVISRINEIYRNKMIVIGIIGIFCLLLLYSILWLFIPILLILIYVAYKSNDTKSKQLGLERKIMGSLGTELKKLNENDKSKFYEVAGYYNTGQWFISDSALGFHFFNTTDICWVHLQNTRHSANFVPTGTSYGIRIYLKSGLVLTEDYGYKSESQTIAATKMVQLRSIAPWAIYGWSQQLKTLWDNNRVNFVSMVEQNWKRILQQFWTQHRAQQNRQNMSNQPIMPITRYYTILGLKPNANQDQIKEAYRKLVKKYHPDISKSKQAQEKMKEINEAYSILIGKYT